MARKLSKEEIGILLGTEGNSSPETQSQEISPEVTKGIEKELGAFLSTLLGKDQPLDLKIVPSYKPSPEDIAVSQGNSVSVIFTEDAFRSMSKGMLGESFGTKEAGASDLARELAYQMIGSIREQLSSFDLSPEVFERLGTSTVTVGEDIKRVDTPLVFSIGSGEKEGEIYLSLPGLSYKEQTENVPEEKEDPSPEVQELTERIEDAIQNIEYLKKSLHTFIQEAGEKKLLIDIAPFLDILNDPNISEEKLAQAREIISDTENPEHKKELNALLKQIRKHLVSLNRADSELEEKITQHNTKEDTSIEVNTETAESEVIETSGYVEKDLEKMTLKEIFSETEKMRDILYDSELKSAEKKKEIAQRWDAYIDRAFEITESLPEEDRDYRALYNHARSGSAQIKRAFEHLTDEEKAVEQKGTKEDKKKPSEERGETDPKKVTEKRYEHEISPQEETEKEPASSTKPVEIDVPYTPEGGGIPPEGGTEEGEEMSPLDSARVAYLKALRLRGNIVRGKLGALFGRKMKVGEENQSFAENLEGNRALRKLEKAYRTELAAHIKESLEEEVSDLPEEATEEQKTYIKWLKTEDILREDQEKRDDVVLNKFDQTLGEKFRRVWRNKFFTRGRIGFGAGMLGASATGAFVGTGIGGIALLSLRGVLGTVGMYTMSEAWLERTRWIGHKGLVEDIYNTYTSTEEIQEALRNKYTEEEIKKEAARLQMLQIVKGTAVDSSYHTKKTRKEVIQLILERNRELVAQNAIKERTEGKEDTDILFESAMDKLNRELSEGNKVLEEAGESERNRAMVRKGLAASIGLFTGVLVGSKANSMTEAVPERPDFSEAVPDTAEIPATPIDSTDAAPDTTNIAEPSPADSADAVTPATPEPTPATETLGFERITIDQKGEGMITAIAQHLETTHEITHEKAMEIGNHMYIDGLKEYTSIVENLAGEGVDIDALKELEFSLTEEGIGQDEWTGRMQEFLTSHGVDESLAQESAEALYEDGRMFNLVQLNDSFTLDLSQISAEDLKNLSAEEIVEGAGIDYDSGTFTSTEPTPAPNYDLPTNTQSIDAALEANGAVKESILSPDVREDYVTKLKAALEGFDAQQAEYTKGTLDIDARLALAEQEAEYRELLNGLLDDSVDVAISQDQWDFYQSLESVEAAREAGAQQVFERIQPMETLPPEPISGANIGQSVEASPSPEAVSPSEILSSLSEQMASQTEIATQHTMDALDEVYGDGEGPNASVIAGLYSTFSEAEAPITETFKSLSDEKLQLVDSIVDQYVENHTELQELPREEQQTIGQLREYIDALLKQRGK